MADVRLPGKERSTSLDARLVHPIITMIKWIRTSRLSIMNSLFWGAGHEGMLRIKGKIMLRTPDAPVPTRGPSWGHPRVVLGTIGAFLEPFCGHLSPKNDKVS